MPTNSSKNTLSGREHEMDRRYVRAAFREYRQDRFRRSAPREALDEVLIAWLRGLRPLDAHADVAPVATEPTAVEPLAAPARAPEAAISRSENDRWLDDGGECGEAQAS